MLRSLPLLLALAAAAAAQSAPCLSFNDTTNGIVGGITGTPLTGPTSLGYQFTPNVSQSAAAAQIYTENLFQARHMALEIWSDQNNLPGQRLAGGGFAIQTTWQLSWRGCNFDQVVNLVSGTPYWLVWIEPGASRLPYDPSATTPMPVARRPNNGVWTAQIPQQALKLRLFCAPLDDLNVTPLGPGCVGAGGLASTFTNQPPTLGNSLFLVEGNGFPTATTSLLVIGVQQPWTPIALPGGPPGCFLNADPFLVLTGVTGTGNVASPTGPSGYAKFSLAIPAGGNLAGFTLGLQLGALDTSFAVPTPIVTGNGLTITLY